MKRAPAALLGSAAALLAAAPALAQPGGEPAPQPPPPPAPPPAVEARLQGAFAMQGTITYTKHVRGEHRGEQVQRRWLFAPGCPEGPCEQVTLTRERAGGVSDELVLARIAPGTYSASGRFFVPLRCGKRVYRRGGAVPYTVTLQITAAAPDQSGQLFATALAAQYLNTRRQNLTPCPGGIGSDRASYSGALAEAFPPVTPAPPPASPAAR